MIEQIQDTLMLLAVSMVLIIWFEAAWNGKSKETPHWVMVVVLSVLVLSVVGVIGITFYRIWV